MHEEHWYSCSETRLQWEPTTWAQSADHLALRMKVKVFWSISSTAEGKLQTKQSNRENTLTARNSDSLKIEKSGLVIFLVKLKLTKPLALPFDRHFVGSILKSIVCNFFWQPKPNTSSVTVFGIFSCDAPSQQRQYKNAKRDSSFTIFHLSPKFPFHLFSGSWKQLKARFLPPPLTLG